jgi:cyclase
MLRPRIIPCLLVHNKGLVKTINFKNPTYVGDPINVVRIFNEKQVDELIVLDIDASVESKEPDYKMIEQLASECSMPLCYGGGIRDGGQMKRIIGLGVEKVAVSSGVIERPEIVSEASRWVGNQSIVVVLDVKKRPTDGSYEVYTHNGKRATGHSAVEMAKRMEAAGAGEIVVNSIDNDGLMKGYDLDLFRGMRSALNIPLTCLGGAGSLADIGRLIKAHGMIGAAAGSLFVFKGMYRAVLVNYPNRIDKDALIATSYCS